MSKGWGIMLALLAGTQAHADVQVSDPHYSIALNGDWSARPSADDEQKTYYSKALNTTLVMSSIGMSAPREKLEEIAHLMAQLRIKGEDRAAVEYNVKMTIAEPIVVRRPWGYAIAYYGSDTSGRHFSYAGVVIKTAVISVYVESPTASEKELGTTLNGLIENLKFSRD